MGWCLATLRLGFATRCIGPCLLGESFRRGRASSSARLRRIAVPAGHGGALRAHGAGERDRGGLVRAAGRWRHASLRRTRGPGSRRPRPSRRGAAKCPPGPRRRPWSGQILGALGAFSDRYLRWRRFSSTITVSVGAARGKGRSALRAADEALFKAKSSGRNRLSVNESNP